MAAPEFVIVTVFWEVEPTLVESITSAVGATAKSGTGGGALPIPATATESGLLAALCASFREADLAPAEVGAKVRIKIWLDPTPIEAEVGKTENCDGSVPETVTEETFSANAPRFETVKVFWDVKPRSTESIANETGDTLNKGAGGGALPTPLTLIVSGLPAAL